MLDVLTIHFLGILPHRDAYHNMIVDEAPLELTDKRDSVLRDPPRVD